MIGVAERPATTNRHESWVLLLRKNHPRTSITADRHSALCTLAVTYPLGYVRRYGRSAAGNGRREPAHLAGDSAGSPRLGRRTGRRAADRPARRLPPSAGSPGSGTCPGTPGRATEDLQPASGAARRGGRVAR